jgi:hypothetical protein
MMTIQLTISGKDLNQTFRKALATVTYFSKHVKVGYKILLQAPDGELKEAILK